MVTADDNTRRAAHTPCDIQYKLSRLRAYHVTRLWHWIYWWDTYQTNLQDSVRSSIILCAFWFLNYDTLHILNGCGGTRPKVMLRDGSHSWNGTPSKCSSASLHGGAPARKYGVQRISWWMEENRQTPKRHRAKLGQRNYCFKEDLTPLSILITSPNTAIDISNVAQHILSQSCISYRHMLWLAISTWIHIHLWASHQVACLKVHCLMLLLSCAAVEHSLLVGERLVTASMPPKKTNTDVDQRGLTFTLSKPQKDTNSQIVLDSEVVSLRIIHSMRDFIPANCQGFIVFLVDQTLSLSLSLSVDKVHLTTMNPWRVSRVFGILSQSVSLSSSCMRCSANRSARRALRSSSACSCQRLSKRVETTNFCYSKQVA